MKKTVVSIEEVKRKMERYCVYQDRCHQEVEKKMKEYHLIPEAKEYILLHLLEHNFLNEERFAKSFTRGKFRIKKWGRIKIIRELKFRFISDYIIKEALQEISKTEYYETLCELVVKKNKTLSEKNSYKRKKKLINFLTYKGYELHLIYDAIDEIVGFK